MMPYVQDRPNEDATALRHFAGSVEYLEKRVLELRRATQLYERTFNVTMLDPYDTDVHMEISAQAAHRFFKAELATTEKRLRDVRAKMDRIRQIVGQK